MPIEPVTMPEVLIGLVDPVGWDRCRPYFSRDIEMDVESYLVQKKAKEKADEQRLQSSL